MRRSAFPVLAALLLSATGLASAAEPLDPADQAFRAAAYRAAWTAPLGSEQRWRNPATGRAGWIKPLKERLDGSSRQPCREILENLSIGGQAATGYAVGCRGADGNWRIVQASMSEQPVNGPAPADLAPYVPSPDVSADAGGSGDLSGLPPQARILIPYRGASGVLPVAPR